ncbi:MAG: hypothetical protein JWP44_2202 [Mucilaginibacter sp.]|nr:hypothetical protein [Mucilaginibacter sp.]
MKTSFYITAFCILFLSIFLVWTKFEINNHDISISVHEDDDSYKFSASYNDSNTSRIQQYINNSITPNRLAGSENDNFDATTTLADRTRFYVLEKPGRLKIELDKRKNSTASYLRIKKMCEGVKGVLAGK